MAITKEHEEALDMAVGQILAGCLSAEEANEALLHCFSSPILCLIAAANQQGQPEAIPGILGNCAKQSVIAIKTCLQMHQTGQFAEIDKEGKH